MARAHRAPRAGHTGLDLTARRSPAYALGVSTVIDIKRAIERLSPAERAELEALVWPEGPGAGTDETDTPPRVREKLAEAAAGRFLPGDRANIERILASLG